MGTTRPATTVQGMCPWPTGQHNVQQGRCTRCGARDTTEPTPQTSANMVQAVREPRPSYGDVVTGVRLGGKRRQTITVRDVSDVAVVGPVHYSGTQDPTSVYYQSYRGYTALDPDTIRPA